MSELIAEKTNEKTIVMANWLYSRPVKPGDEGHRNEDRPQHQGDRDDRRGDLGHRRADRRDRPLAALQVFLDVLDHDDRVVDHQADGQDQARKA